jgi:hypothetical protein
MKSIGNILMRIVATFAASGLSVIGAGAIAGVDTITAVAAVVEKLARGFMNDGKLDLEEINAAFAAVDTKAKSESDLKVEAKQNGTDILISAAGAVSYAAASKPQVPEEQPVDEDWDKEDK